MSEIIQRKVAFAKIVVMWMTAWIIVTSSDLGACQAWGRIASTHTADTDVIIMDRMGYENFIESQHDHYSDPAFPLPNLIAGSTVS